MKLPLSADFDLIDQESWSVGGVDWAALCGWFITEGHIPYQGKIKSVYIYQSKSANLEKVKRIRQLLQSVGAVVKEKVSHRLWRGRPSVCVTFKIRGRVARLLIDRTCSKHMTHKLANLNVLESEALLSALIDGDGHRREDGRTSIIQKDRRDIELMQLLAIRLGYKTAIGSHDDCWSLYLTRKRWVCVRGTNGRHDTMSVVDYKGKVWCPETETGFWLACKDGKQFITGNTFPRKLITPCILAGTSEKGACGVCGSPWKRVVDTKYEKTQETNNPHKISRLENSSGIWTRMRMSNTTIGWEPTCTCNGRFRKRKRVKYGDVQPQSVPVGWAVGSESRQAVDHQTTEGVKESKEARDEYALGKRKRRVITWYEYIPRIPLEDHPVVPCVVLDPFIGSGTTCCVCIAEGRDSIGIDLSEEYLRKNAIPRIEGELISRPALAYLTGRKAKRMDTGVEV